LLKQEVPEIAVSLGLEVKLYVVADETIMPGGCVLTTSNGVIDASIESQLTIISEVLKEI
jgi:flagellar biosynthesis/type III secretory pathway protein FliH